MFEERVQEAGDVAGVPAADERLAAADAFISGIEAAQSKPRAAAGAAAATEPGAEPDVPLSPPMQEQVAPHLAVPVGFDTLHGAPGAMPAVAASGARLPLSLVRSWWCDSAAPRFVLSLGRKVIEASHTERTLKPHERRAKRIETGGRCQAAGCRCGPGIPLIPHHPNPWWRCGTTSKDETVLMCKRSHHDLHSGGHTLRLKDGRWLNEHGWTDGPAG